MAEGIPAGTIRSNLSEMKITQEQWDKIFKKSNETKNSTITKPKETKCRMTN